MQISKRGRKPIDSMIKPLILSILSNSSHPLTTHKLLEKIQKKISQPPLNYKKRVSWNTLKKYLDELEKDGFIFSKKLPPSKARYYWTKPIPW